MLVNVEQGSANPSIGTLLKIGDALGVGLPALVEPPVRARMQVTKRGDCAVLWQSESGGNAVLVAGTPPPHVVELWDWVLGPGDRYSGGPHTPGTKELIHVLAGDLTVDVGDDTIQLAEGDAMDFPGDVSHAYVNDSPLPVRFALTVFEPDVGPRTRSEADNV